MASTPPATKTQPGPGLGLGLGFSEPAPSVQQASSQPPPANRRPTLPSSFFKFPVRTRLKVIQQYISSFDYKQSPQTSFNSHKSRPLSRIMDTAKMMIYNPQPIKCVEAVFLALYLTAGIPDAERIPLGFKSELHGQVHQHIVLLVRYNSKYGAFGISRQQNLMSKEFEFESISSIIHDFKKAYEQYEHKVIRIRVGLPVEHNIESFNFVCWRHLSIDPSSTTWERCSEALERHMTHAKRLWERGRIPVKGAHPGEPHDAAPQTPLAASTISIRWLLDGQRENRRADLFLKNLDTKPIGETEDNCSRRRLSEHCLGSPTVKAVKRRQEPADKQESDFKLVKRRQALRESPSFGNMPNQPLTCKISTSKIKALPLFPNKSPRELPTSTRCQSLRIEPLFAKPIAATHKKNVKKIALKCYSMELFSGSCERYTNGKKPNVNLDQDKKDKGRLRTTVRKPEVLGLPAALVSSRKSSARRMKQQ